MGHWVKEADQQMRSFWAATAVKAATGFFVLAWADPEPDQQAALRGVPLPSDSPYGSLVAAWVRKLNCFFLRVLFFACFRGRGLGDDPTQTLESAPRQTGKEEVWKQRWTVGHWHQLMGLDQLFSCSYCIYYLIMTCTLPVGWMIYQAGFEADVQIINFICSCIHNY